MINIDRREFIKRTGATAAVLPWPSASLVAAATASSRKIPPHRAVSLPGVHAYAEKSVVAGSTLRVSVHEF